MTTARWPETDEEWTEAIRAAVFCAGVHAAVLYGLVATATVIDMERVDAVLDRARHDGRRIPTLEEVLG